MNNQIKKLHRICAVALTIVMSALPFGAMPINATEVSLEAENIIAVPMVEKSESLVKKVIVPLVDFDDYSTLAIPVEGGNTAVSADLLGWSEDQPLFTLQNDSKKTGTVYANAELKEDSTTDKYFNQLRIKYIENGQEKSSTSVALNYYATKNSKLGQIAIKEDEKLEYGISLHPQKTAHLYNRINGDADTSGFLNAIFTVESGNLYIFDGNTKSDQAKKDKALGIIELPSNRWSDVRIVYTAGDGKDNNAASGGTDDKVDVYINGASTPAFSGSLAADYLSSSSSRLTFHGHSSFDNFYVTKWEKPLPEEDPGVMGINHYPNDFTYFHSERVMLSSRDYEFAKLAATTGNSYFIEPSDKKNQYKGDRLIMTRQTDASGDSYVAMNVPTYGVTTDYVPVDRAYKYFHIDGLFHITSSDLGGEFARVYVEDENEASGNKALVSFAGGNLIANGNSKPIKVSDGNKDKWHHLQMIVNLEDDFYDVLLDGEVVCQGASLGDAKKLIKVRTILNQGIGELQIREMEVTGLSKKPSLVQENGRYDFNIVHTSQFIDDNLTRTYLSDKVVFHGDGDMVYNKGVKTEYTENSFVYDDSKTELYVPVDTFNHVMAANVGYLAGWSGVVSGAEPRYIDEELYVPVKAMTQALGYESEYYSYGKMVIVAQAGSELPESDPNDAKPWFDEQYYSTGWCKHPQTKLSDTQEIANFVFYDRPTATQLEASYNAYIENAEANEKDAHPMLVLTSEKVAEMKQNIAADKENRAFSNVYTNAINTIESNAKAIIRDNYIVKYEFNEDDEYRTLSAAGKFSDNMIKLGLAYHLTSDESLKEDCAELAVANMKEVAALPDFNYGHVIDAGVWLYGCAIGFDWFYYEMTEQDRAKIAEAVLEIGLRPMNRTFYAMLPSALSKDSPGLGNMGNANQYVKWKSNFIPYTQHGLVMSSLVLAEYEPDVCFDTIEKCIRNWEYSNLGLYPAGGWLEGKSYLNVVHNNTAYTFASLLNVMGDEYKVLQAPGFEESLDAVVQLTSGIGSFCYSDEGTYHGGMIGIPGALCFYADYYNRDDFHKIRQYRYRSGDTNAWNWLDVIYHKHFEGKSASTLRTEGFKNFDTIHYTEGTEIVTIHEDWSSGNFFALAGGPTRHYHFHNDGGDFNLCMGGKRWTYELGTGNYNIGTNYTKYAGRAEGHNTLVINPDDDPATSDTVTSGAGSYTWTAQQEQSFAAIMDYKEIINGGRRKGAYTTLDMTELYEHTGAQRVHRGMWVDNNYDTVTIRDEIVFSEDEEFDGWWFMHTKADVEQVDDNTFILRLAGSEKPLEKWLPDALASKITSVINTAVNNEKNAAIQAGTPLTDEQLAEVRQKWTEYYNTDEQIEFYTQERTNYYNNTYASKLYVQLQVDGADEYEAKVMPAEPLPSSPTVENDPTATDGVRKLAIYYKGSGEIDITVRATTSSTEYKNTLVNTMDISEWENRCATETEDGKIKYSISAEYNENYNLVAVEYNSSGRVVSVNPAEVAYNNDTGAYDCIIVPVSTSSSITYGLYLWDKNTFKPISKPVRLRKSDLALIIQR